MVDELEWIEYDNGTLEQCKSLTEEEVIALAERLENNAKAMRAYAKLRKHPIVQVIKDNPGLERYGISALTGEEPDHNLTNFLLECRGLGIIEGKPNKQFPRSTMWYIAGTAPKNC